MKISQLVFILFLGVAGLSSLQAADLMSVYQEALAQDAQYRSARAAYEDAQEKLKAGASLVQVWTGFIYEGPAIVKKIVRTISTK